MITGRDSAGYLKEYGTVRDWLKDAKVVSFKINSDGLVRAQEKCDGYFSCFLTRDQLLMLADELRALAMEGTK